MYAREESKKAYNVGRLIIARTNQDRETNVDNAPVSFAALVQQQSKENNREESLADLPGTERLLKYIEENQLSIGEIIVTPCNGLIKKNFKNIRGEVLLEKSDVTSMSDGDLSSRKAFILALENTYKRFSHIDKLFDDESSLEVDASFINVAIISMQEQADKDGELVNNSSLKSLYQADEGNLAIYEKIYTPEREIALTEMFFAEENPKKLIHHIVVEGRAGVGKSTLSKFLAYQWSRRNILSDYGKVQAIRDLLKNNFSGVFWISLRELNKYKPADKTDITELLVNQPGFSFSKSALRSTTQKEEEKRKILDELVLYEIEHDKPILYIIDGWDELGFDLNEQSDRGDVLRALLEQPQWLITSRPGRIPGDVLNKSQRHLSLLGLSSEDAETYIQDYFSDNGEDASSLSNRLIKFIENPSIAGLARIPINLRLLCYAWKDQKGLSDTTTLAELYYEIVSTLMAKFDTRIVAISDGKMQKIDKKSRAGMWHTYQKSIQCLQELAYHAFNQKALELDFDSQETQQIYLRHRNEVDKNQNAADLFNQVIFNFEGLKLLQNCREGQKQDQGSYYFVHLSFQEFFSACHLFYQLCSHSVADRQSASAWLSGCKYFLRCRVVLAFLVNLLHLKNSSSFAQISIASLQGENNSTVTDIVSRAQKLFWLVILTEEQDIIGNQQIDFLVFLASHMSISAENYPEYREICVLVTEAIELCRKKLSYSYFFKKGTNPQRIMLGEITHTIKYSSIEFRTKWLMSLLNFNEDDETFVCHVRDIGRTANVPLVVDELYQRLLKSTVWKTQCGIIEVLLSYGSFAINSDKLSEIFKIISERIDINFPFKEFSVLKNFRERAACPMILDCIIRILKEEGKESRIAAYKFIEAIGREATKYGDIFSRLCKGVVDEKRTVRGSACEVIESLNIPRETVFTEIRQDILDALCSSKTKKDKRYEAGCHAIQFLKMIAISDVAICAKLLEGLFDDECTRRELVGFVIQELSPEIFDVPFIRAELLRALQHEDEDIKKNALYILSEINGPVDESSDFLKVLLFFLTQQEDFDNVINAMRVIEKFGRNLMTQEVENKLNEYLQNSDEEISEAASNTLLALTPLREQVCNVQSSDSKETSHQSAQGLSLEKLLEQLNNRPKPIRDAVKELYQLNVENYSQEVYVSIVKFIFEDYEDQSDIDAPDYEYSYSQAQRDACAMLNTLTSEKVTPDIVSTICDFLRDESCKNYIKLEIIQAMRDKFSSIKEIHDVLLKLLNGQDPDMQYGLIEIFSTFVKDIFFSNILETALKDPSALYAFLLYIMSTGKFVLCMQDEALKIINIRSEDQEIVSVPNFRSRFLAVVNDPVFLDRAAFFSDLRKIVYRVTPAISENPAVSDKNDQKCLISGNRCALFVAVPIVVGVVAAVAVAVFNR